MQLNSTKHDATFNPPEQTQMCAMTAASLQWFLTVISSTSRCMLGTIYSLLSVTTQQSKTINYHITRHQHLSLK